MKQLQFYKYAALILVLLNIGLITFLFMGIPKPPGNGMAFDFRSKAIEILQLDEQQKASFLELAEQHRQLMDSVNEQQSALLKPFFQTIIDTSYPAQTESTFKKTEQLESKKIKATIQHFLEVKSLLREEQHVNFEVYLNQALEMILLKKGNNPPPPEGILSS